MSKFKIGDKVIKTDGHSWCTYDGSVPKYRTICDIKRDVYCLTFGENEMSEKSNVPWFDNEIKLYKEEAKTTFKVGDKVAKVDGSKWNMSNGVKLDYRTVRAIHTVYGYKLSKTKDSVEYSEINWRKDEIKLYEEPKTEDKPKKVVELSPLGVINHLVKDGVEGETWVVKNIDHRANGLDVQITKVGQEVRTIFPYLVGSHGYIINSKTVYVKKEDIKTVRTICKVEHTESGKRYDFRTDLLVFNESMVVCETKFGKSYGKVVSFEDINMTNSEYNEYSKIIKVI